VGEDVVDSDIPGREFYTLFLLGGKALEFSLF